MKKITASALFFLLLMNVAFGQMKKEYYMLVKKADSLFTAKDYKNAGKAYTAAFMSEGNKGAITDRYKAAQAWAMANVADSAFLQLFRIVNKSGFRDYDKISAEADFTNLHSDARWTELLKVVKENQSFNLGFENVKDAYKIPNPWFRWGTKNYVLRVDSTIKHKGKYSFMLTPLDNIDDKSFGCVAQGIAAEYEGKEIELRAYIKMENTIKGIGLMIREDGMDPKKAFEFFDNMQKKGIMGTKDWTMYSVKLPLSPEAKTIYIGAILSGTGTLWVDDFEVLIDGKDISQAPKKKK
jgi:hypothetical protein